jgi:hypothetical protein
VFISPADVAEETMQFVSFPPLADLAVFGFLALVVLATVGLVGALAYLDHRKTMALVETGQYAASERDSRDWVLAVGLVLVAIGLGGIAETLVAGAPIEGLTTAFVGLAALAYYAVKHRATAAPAADRDAGLDS